MVSVHFQAVLAEITEAAKKCQYSIKLWQSRAAVNSLHFMPHGTGSYFTHRGSIIFNIAMYNHSLFRMNLVKLKNSTTHLAGLDHKRVIQNSWK